MKLHRPTVLNRLAKQLAKPASSVATLPRIHKPLRMLDAYLNFLLGKGCGTGWDMSKETQIAVAHINRPNPLVFDVGANIGLWTESLIAYLPRANIYMFEPSIGCQNAIRQKNFPGTTLMPFAVGEAKTQQLYYSSSLLDASASLHPRRDTPFADHHYEETLIEVRTIDDIIESENIDYVDFLKMDIEGHELFALKGARNSLAAKKVKALSFEFGCGNINSRTFFKDFYELLRDYHYTIKRVTPAGRMILVEEYYEDLEYFRGASNYVATLAANVD